MSEKKENYGYGFVWAYICLSVFYMVQAVRLWRKAMYVKGLVDLRREIERWLHD